MKYTIECVNDNPFNEGWLAFILGLTPDATRPYEWKDGWLMASETPSLASTRYVFEKQKRLESPQYVITEER